MPAVDSTDAGQALLARNQVLARLHGGGHISGVSWVHMLCITTT